MAEHGEVQKSLFELLNALNTFRKNEFRKLLVWIIGSAIVLVGLAVALVSVLTGNEIPEGPHERAIRRVIEVRRMPESSDLPDYRSTIEITFDMGEPRRHRFASRVGKPLIVKFDQDGRDVLVVGLEGIGADAKLMAFYADEWAEAPIPKPFREIAVYKRPPWDHQTFGEHVIVNPLLHENLDEYPGEELVVVLDNPRGPSEVVVFTKGLIKLSSFWHYGHVKDGFAADVHGTSHKELILWAYANERKPVKLGEGISEPFHAAIMVIKPLEVDDRWSMNDWMNSQSKDDERVFTRLIAYAYVSERFIESDEGWSLQDIYPEDIDPKGKKRICAEFANEYWIQCDGDLKLERVEDPSEGMNAKEGAEESEVTWVRMDPNDYNVTRSESITDRP